MTEHKRTPWHIEYCGRDMAIHGWHPFVWSCLGCGESGLLYTGKANDPRGYDFYMQIEEARVRHNYITEDRWERDLPGCRDDHNVVLLQGFEGLPFGLMDNVNEVQAVYNTNSVTDAFLKAHSKAISMALEKHIERI